MAEPGSRTGPSGDGADLASTDMSAEPSSRDEETQAVFSHGAGVPVEPDVEAIRRLESQLEESRDRQLRLAAEFDNYRKRIVRERAEQTDRAQASLVTRLLDVLDDMDRLSAEGSAGSAEPSSRDEETQAVFGHGAGVPVEPDVEAIRRLESQLEESRDRQLRLAAEFDNYRKRIVRERAEQTDRAQASLVTRLLDVLDDMDRLSAEGSAGSAESLRQAVELVDRKLRKELEAAGVERIDPVGQPFDPNVHEAVSTVPPPKPDLDHTVSATFQTGYRFKGTLVRPARVQVYSGQEQA